MAAARTPRLRKRIARFLCHRPPPYAFCAAAGEIYPRKYLDARGDAESKPDSSRWPDCLGAKWCLKKKRQTICDGDARRFARLGASAVHERKLRQKSGLVDTRPGHSCRRRSQYGRRAAKDLSAGDHAAGRRATALHEAGAFAPEHGACEARTPGVGPTACFGLSRQMPIVSLFCAAGGRSDFCGNPRKIFRDAVATTAASRGSALWQRDVLRKG